METKFILGDILHPLDLLDKLNHLLSLAVSMRTEYEDRVVTHEAITFFVETLWKWI